MQKRLKINGLSQENMKAWVDRKLFIHNLGHAATAYLGYQYNPKFIFLYETLAVPSIFLEVHETMLQSAALLLEKYPNEFTMQHLIDHTDDLLKRFQNKALGDTIFRVGCDLQRKLGAKDRLAAAIHLALELDLPYDKIRESLVAGCYFRATDESGKQLPEDLKFNELFDSGIENVLVQICGFSEIHHSHLLNEAKIHEKNI